MQTRRSFAKLLAATAAGSTLSFYPTALTALDSAISLEGQFGFSFQNNKLIMDAKDVLIQGLTIPVFTWGWVGLAVASGVVSGFGTAIFGAIANLLHSQPNGPSIEELLAQQLDRINSLVEQAIARNEVQKCEADLNTYTRRFQEFNLDPRPRELSDLRNEILKTIGRLEKFDFIGYRPYMVSAALRLSVIQQQIKARDGRQINLQKVFEKQREDASHHHDHIQNVIDLETSMATFVQRTHGKWNILPRDIGYIELHNWRILSEKLNGRVWVYLPTSRELSNAEVLVEFGKNYNLNTVGGPDRVSLADTRKRLMDENTSIGEAMVDTWKKAKLTS